MMRRSISWLFMVDESQGILLVIRHAPTFGVVVVDGDTCGISAQAAGVGGQADALHDIHVIWGKILIHISAQ